MNEVCIFKVNGGRGIYRVCQRTTRGGYITFAVKKERRLALPVSVFWKVSDAINAAYNAAYEDCKDINKLIYML